MSELRALRESRNLTQREAAQNAGISLRSYISYENDPAKENTLKYRYLMQEVGRMNQLDETHGILSVFPEYDIDYCYLFGSYAKGKAVETSDVDLLVSGSVTGLKFYELAEKLREELHKQVDLLDRKQLVNNEALLDEVLKDGVKIYG